MSWPAHTFRSIFDVVGIVLLWLLLLLLLKIEDDDLDLGVARINGDSAIVGQHLSLHLFFRSVRNRSFHWNWSLISSQPEKWRRP